MVQAAIHPFRDCVRKGHYSLTFHAVEELAEDDLDILDLESAILSGKIQRVEREDPRGEKYVIQGLAYNRPLKVGVVVRWVGEAHLLVITAYEVD